MQSAHDELGGLDTLVNAAASTASGSRPASSPVESWDKTIAVNLSGTFYVCRAALPLMVAAAAARS